MRWEKLGLVFSPGGRYAWMQTHAQLPVADVQADGRCRVYFATRDADQRSHIGYVDLDPRAPTERQAVSDRPVLAPGPIGCFDEHGVYPASLAHVGDQIYLYYVGWTRGSPAPLFYAAIGLAVSDDGGRTFRRHAPAPILSRSAHDPCLVTSPCVFRVGTQWRMVYVSGLRWEWHDGRLHSYYHLKSADSRDGIAWSRDGRVAIDFQSPDETNIARASVLRVGNAYRMWYCHAGREHAYRLGYAESPDALDWTRRDGDVGLACSPDGFDSEMRCYPHVIAVAGVTYMFYNGNAYGRDGIGLAVLQE